jgi:UDP-glucuronate 4-epimerase
MNILLTGGAGFIGSALAKRLILEGHKVIVADNFNQYYDVRLKRDRVRTLLPEAAVYVLDITKKDELRALCKTYSFDAVCHLAAQAGVRYSVEAPEVYVNTNILGTQNILEVMKEVGIRHMVYASTSSAYGTSTPAPFTETASADRPVSVYAATKRSAEMMAHNYFVQYGIETTCLRFFTVYGPWSRPDMAMLKFAQKMQKGKPIELYNYGNLQRDFTYIDDIVDGFIAALKKPLGYEILNLGNASPVKLTDFVDALEEALGIHAEKILLPMQQGDVYETHADITKANQLLGYQPRTNFKDGVKQFADWFIHYEQTCNLYI